jgi:hypothetical protein
MGFLGKQFGEKATPAALLVDAMTQLQVGILTNLIVEYRSLAAQANVTLLAAAVLNEAVLESPINAEADQFSRAHSELVRKETLKLCQNPDIAEALSYLYVAKTLHLAFATRNPLSEEAERLGERATELGIYIPNTYDVCGSGDAIECIRAIGEFAKKYSDHAFGR